MNIKEFPEIGNKTIDSKLKKPKLFTKKHGLLGKLRYDLKKTEQQLLK